MRVDQLSGPFGVAVSEIDLASQMTDSTMAELVSLLHDHQILAITGQNLSEADYLRFGYYWGKPVIYPRQADTHPDHPEIICISNSTRTPERYRDSAIHWHSDSSYEEVPAAVTMLYGVESPQTAGVTMVANTTLAYDALSEEMKQRIDGLTALHCLSGSPELPSERTSVFPEAIARQGITRHPLVMRHPVTGRKSIFTSGTAFGAEDLDPDEGRALIHELRLHITQPQFVNSYKVGVGDIFLWDNYQTLHTATPAKYSDEEGERRLLYRISTRGVPAVCHAEFPDENTA